MNSRTNRNGQRGFSLAEVMVATAILVVILVGILMLYDRANKVFKTGNEAAEMQQNVRIAYDRMIGDIRMAGFDYKRGGVLLPGQTAAPWASGRAYSSGTIVTPTAPNGHTYRATMPGTSGPTEPSWPTTVGLIVTEGGATPPIDWQENGGAVYEQADEQIEYAGSTALTLRANYDYSANETGDVDHGREPALETAQFPMVTTDNEEIVTYALVSDQAPAGTAPNNQSVSMFIDINNGGAPSRTAHPGGATGNPSGAERSVSVTGVDLTNNNPPYTLYRFNFADDGSVQRTPLASNIRSLNLFYFQDPQATQPLRDAAGALAPNVGGGGQYSPAVAGSINSPDRLVRRKIHGVRVRLVGMSSQPDNNYADTSTATGQLGATSTAGVTTFVADTVTVGGTQRPMQNYRRLAVDTVVVPRNLGVAGMAQTFLQPPPRPTINNVCIGYCGIAVVSWDPNTNNPNASYVVMWDRSNTGSFSNAFDAGTSNTFAVDLTQEDLSQPFYFQVRAFNAGGSVLSTNIFGPVSAANATRPDRPNTVKVTGGPTSPAPIAGKIHLTWSAPTTNVSGNPSCTTGPPPVTNYLREIKGFRIYRESAAGFNASLANRILDENASGSTAPTTDGYGNYSWDDTNVTCGTKYYYRVRAVEWCQVAGNYNTSGSTNDALSDVEPVNTANAVEGQSGTTGTPKTPVNFIIAPDVPNTPPLGLTNSSCDIPTDICTVNMSWGRVTQTTAPVLPVSIDVYNLERRQFALNPITGVYSFNGVTTPLTMNNALLAPAPGSTPPAPDPSTVFFTDSAPYIDPATGARFEYDYTVQAMQVNPYVPPSPCVPSGVTARTAYPPPCTFTGSVVVQTGASAGLGLTPGNAWVMNTGDTISVNPPGGTTFSNTVMQISDPGGTVIQTTPTTASPALFTWANLTPGVVYTVTFTMTNTAILPALPCTETLTRYIEQEPVPACSLTTLAMQPSMLAQTATNYQLKLDLINNVAEALDIQEINIEWNQPTRITWNSIKFPSAAAATVPGPGTTSGAFTVTLNPRPVQLSASDVTVPASGSRSLLFNFAKTNGNPPNVDPAAITFICVKYRRASVTQLVGATQVPIDFFCAIAPDAQGNNPTSCR